MFGKLENGKFIKAKHFIIDEKATIINPTDEMYEKYGYKRLVETEMPELSEGDILKVGYVEATSEITKVYRVVKSDDEDIC